MRKAKRVIYFVCAVIILLSAWNIICMNAAQKETDDYYSTLAQHAHPYTGDQTGPVQKSFSSDVEAGEGQEETVNQWLLDLRAQNRELAGWITVPGTVIDYPVMQTEKDDDFYLTHNFSCGRDRHGTPFADVNCSTGESDNLIIYGHNMKDGTMFAGLMNYRDSSFCEKNGPVMFYTPQRTMSFEVFCVMVISAKEAEDFPYYQYTDFKDESEFSRYLQNCSHYSVWSGKMPEYGEKMLTLSTCEYSKEDGRLVVMARCL